MSNLIDSEPRPKETPVEVSRWEPLTSGSIELPAGAPLDDVAFGTVLDERRSVRDLEQPSLDRLGALFWHAARIREIGRGRAGVYEHRAAASAGGLHAIELLVLDPAGGRLLRYDALRHTLNVLSAVDLPKLSRAADNLRALVPDADGYFLLLLGDSARMAGAYEHPQTLLLRDAGCLLATLHLVATALGLGFCPLGLLGVEIAGSLTSRHRFEAVGTAVVGEPRLP